MTDFFVSPTGRDAGNEEGTQSNPFLTITKGISKLRRPGDTLNLFGGTYVETLAIRNLHGTSARRIVIRSFKGRAVIEGTVTQFREAENNDWEPASRHDPDAVADEFVSTDDTFDTSDRNLTNRGAFLEREPYTRLITHSRLEDLRAANQTFDKIPLNDERPGPVETDAKGNSLGHRRPDVYMGPGLFFNAKPGTPTFGRVHIRLSRTTNNVPGIEDYDGETDPGKLHLAISSAGMTTLFIKDSSFIRFENLSVRYGGEFCVLLEKTEGVVFDHVEIFAPTHGVVFRKKNVGTILRHCEIRGGIPPWYFRSDRKGEYFFKDSDGVVVLNKLGKSTSVALLGSGGPESERTTVHNCELRDAHDIIAFGKDFRFHDNWVDNLNDDSLFVDDIRTDNLRVFRNVFTRCLSAVSCAGNKPNGMAFIFRNLFDLREPTADHRPREEGDQNVFRHGQFFKDGEAGEGPLAIFHNTCLVFGPKTQAYFRHYANVRGRNPRRSFNNIFVAVDPDSTLNQPIAFIPPASFPGPTDGNCYFRLSKATKNLFKVGARFFDSLEELTRGPFFEATKVQYPPGYEANSIATNPGFRSFDLAGTVSPLDDFRLNPRRSSARGKAVKLPEDLKALDSPRRLPNTPEVENVDIGCYETGRGGLRVGVDRRRRFPSQLAP